MADEDQKPSTSITTPGTNPTLEAAHAATLPEAHALRPEEVIELNIDILAAIITVTGCQSKLAPFREEIAKHLGTVINMTYIDGMPRYIAALAQANRAHATAAESVAPLVAMADELGKKHELLFGDAETLARHGLIDGSKLPNIKNHNGYRQLSGNVLNLAQLLKTNWSKIEGKTALTMPMVEAAERDALDLVAAAGDKEQRIAVATETAALRLRFFTLFYRMWQEWRRAMKFLRWTEGDEETYAPSLWLGRSYSTKKKGDDKPAEGDVDGKPGNANDAVVAQPGKPPGAQNGQSAPSNGGVMVEQRFDR